MGLRTSAQRLLAGWAARRPHVLLVTAPGRTAARLAVEAQARALGGVLTGEPADADMLVVAGSPDGELADAVAVLWSQIPAPKVRVDVLDSPRAAALLSAGIHRLASTPDAGAESTEPAEPMGEHVHHQEAEMGHKHGGDGGHGHGGHTDAGQGSHEHGGMTTAVCRCPAG
ncbi:hypothetical protein [Flexivirga alba]|uniref:Uncharacterized protein n=1 Tax=Flexivirga alba TaxID=702742 RepID=A0ABW2AI35_9MICO